MVSRSGLAFVPLAIPLMGAQHQAALLTPAIYYYCCLPYNV